MRFHRKPAIPRDVVPADAYDDIDAVYRFLEEVAATGKHVQLRLIEQLASRFPLLAEAECGYIELSESAIDASALSISDKRELTLALGVPCAVMSTASPSLLIGDSFNSLPEETQIEAATHELVHLEQTVRGDLVYVEGGGQIWRGVDYGDIGAINAGRGRGEHYATYLYLTLPWEQEAYIRSGGEEAFLVRVRMFSLTGLAERFEGLDISVQRRNELGSAMYELIAYVQGHGEPPEEPSGGETGVVVASAVDSLGYSLTQVEGWHLWSMIAALLNLPDKAFDGDEVTVKRLLVEAAANMLKQHASNEARREKNANLEGAR